MKNEIWFLKAKRGMFDFQSGMLRRVRLVGHSVSLKGSQNGIEMEEKFQLADLTFFLAAP